MAEDKGGNPMMDFVCGMLRKDRNVSYKEVQEMAVKKGFKIFPIVYGRAKALLGLVPTSPRGQGKAAKAASGTSTIANSGVVKRGPGRPRKVPLAITSAPAAAPASASAPARRGPGRPRKEVSALDSLESLIDAMKQSEGSRDRYRKALEQALGIIQNAL